MSVSVDDLVTSLSSSHIGQEALDLAALQLQLNQTLFTNNQDARRNIKYAQPCNTPTGRASFSWSQSSALNQRLASQGATSRWNIDDNWHDGDQMEEDERMVEELLIPHSPMTVASASRTPGSCQTSFSSGFPIVNSSYPYFTEPSTSHFTTTDPFYMAQIQAAQNPSAGPPFTQSGCPAQQSPFLLQQPHCTRNRGQPTPLDSHSILVAASATCQS